MATRPPRSKRPHTYFHVMSRGGNRWNIFLDEQDRLRFMWLLAAVCKRYGVEVHAYCLMGNHFHLVLYCAEPVLSAAIRDIKSRYARYYNQRHHGSGPVFEAPFVEVPILDDIHLQTEIRYVHRNPLDLDPGACLATYEWSSHAIYLGLRPCPLWFQTRVGLELFGPAYRLAVESPRQSDNVQNLVRPIEDSPGVPSIGRGRPSDRSRDWSLAGIRREVAQAAGCDLIDVRPGLHNGLVGVAALIASRLIGFTADEIAEPFGFRTSKAVYSSVGRAEQRLSKDSELRRVHDRVVARLACAA